MLILSVILIIIICVIGACSRLSLRNQVLSSLVPAESLCCVSARPEFGSLLRGLIEQHPQAMSALLSHLDE